MEEKTFNQVIYEIASYLETYCASHPSENPLSDIEYTIKEVSDVISSNKNWPLEPYWRRIVCCGSEGYLDVFKKDNTSVFKEVAELVIKKQGDYGPSNIIDSPMGPEVGLVIRLYDKVARLKNLTFNNRKPNNESIEDTWKDIIGYSMIGIMVERKQFLLPLNN